MSDVRRLPIEHPPRDPPGRQAARDKPQYHAPGAQQLVARGADERRHDQVDEGLEQPHAELSSSARRMRPESTPRTATVLRRPLAPDAIVTAALGTPSSVATKRSSAAFAAPSAGGAAIRIFTASPCTPTTAVARARGTTWSATRPIIR